MALDLWCWRCRRVVPMVEPHEWTVVEEAREAGANVISVLVRAKGDLPGHDFTPLARHAGVLKRRFAYLRLGYELFTGVHERGILTIVHHRTDLYGPPCERCAKPLRTPQARSCAACGHERDVGEASTVERARCDPGRIRLHVPDLHRMTINDVLTGPLPPSQLGDPFLDALADPALALVHHLGPPTDAARMVQDLFAFYTSVLNDQLTEYFNERDGDALPDVARWCATIGADRAESLAKAFLALYPESLWCDTVGRATFLEELDDESMRSALEALAATRWDDVVEIPARLRQYVEEHLATFEAAQRGGRAATHMSQASVGESKPSDMSDEEWRKLTAIRR